MKARQDARIQQLADQLFHAEQQCAAVKPLTDQYTDLTIDDAYAIQLVNVSRAVGMGYAVSGKKIGLTSAGIQQQMGVSEPDYGHLFAAMEVATGKIKADSLLQPKIEGELAFVLKEDLVGGQIKAADVRAATEYVCAAFEIVDSRVLDWKILLADTVADNASSGRYVLGTVRLPIKDVNLSDVAMKMYRNDTLVCEGKGSAVLGDPCEAVAWLANCLWRYGVTLQKGEVILSGAFAAAPAAGSGDRFFAEFSGFGTVEAEFI